MPGLISYKTFFGQKRLDHNTGPNTYFKQFEWCSRCPSHPLIDQGCQVSDFASTRDIDLANTVQRLSRSIKMLQENHDRTGGDVRFVRIRDDVEIQAEVVLLPDSHIVSDHFDGYTI